MRRRSVAAMSRLTSVQGAAVTIGAVLGTGVITLPALAIRTAGPASLLAWLALIVLSVPLAASFAALGARYPDAGGVSTYVRRAFGRRAAAVVGWCFYLAVMTGAPAAAMFGAGYVSAALGGGRTTTIVVSGLMILGVAGANAFGVSLSGRIQVGLAGLLVALLLVATIAAVPHAHLANLHPFAPHGGLAVVSAATLLVWGFAGWEAVTALAADFRRPARDLPRATAAALVVIGVLYLAIAAASVLVLGSAAGHAQAPLADLLAIAFGGGVRIFAAVAAVLLTLGAMNAYFSGAAKLGAALGRDGALPGWFSHGSQAGEVPRRSLAVVTAMGGVALLVVAASGAGTEVPTRLTTGSFVLVYVLGTAAAVKLLPRRSWSRRAAAFALLCVSALFVLAGWYLLWTLAVAAAALCYDRYRARLERRLPAAAAPDGAERPVTRVGAEPPPADCPASS